MRKKVFICGYTNFPRGSASANYVQYLAQAFIELGYFVVIISNLNQSALDKPNKFLRRYKDDLTLEKMDFPSGKLSHYLTFHFGMGKICRNILDKYSFSEDDLLIAYSTDPFINLELKRTARKEKIKSGACVVEWFPASEFKNKYFGLDFWKFWINFHYIFPKHNFLFPISTYIEDFYRKRDCNTLCLPIMSDPDEFEVRKKSFNLKKKFIYPANGKIKDSVKVVLDSFSNLTNAELERLELHICGIKLKELEQVMTPRLKKEIGKSVIVHKWMDYEDLIRLYNEMHFLILSRGINQMTLANFPSKVPEVMCYGVIPLVSKVGDYTKYYLTDSHDSFIFENNQVEECTSAIRRAANCSESELEQMSSNSRLTSVNKFSYKVWSERIRDFMSTIK